MGEDWDVVVIRSAEQTIVNLYRNGDFVVYLLVLNSESRSSVKLQPAPVDLQIRGLAARDAGPFSVINKVQGLGPNGEDNRTNKLTRI